MKFLEQTAKVVGAGLIISGLGAGVVTIVSMTGWLVYEFWKMLLTGGVQCS